MVRPEEVGREVEGAGEAGVGAMHAVHARRSHRPFTILSTSSASRQLSTCRRGNSHMSSSGR